MMTMTLNAATYRFRDIRGKIAFRWAQIPIHFPFWISHLEALKLSPPKRETTGTYLYHHAKCHADR